ncbi:MAG: formate dehydrogenase accessory sulfurtransferase FdhD [Ardenticatenaceae bacterium]|nr:formate dehydrogenase accessory sulfurtransferase FdhD [Ardenticatenaceae bacterium]
MTVWRWEHETHRLQRKSDYVTAEEPLEIQMRAAGESQTVAITMRTPGNDYELTAGFLYNEGIIKQREEVASMTYCLGEVPAEQEYNLLAVQMAKPRLPEMPQLHRHFFINSACGICGTTMIEDLEARGLQPAADGPLVDPQLLPSLPAKLRAAQTIFETTGGLHAAGLFDIDGNLVELREDVGRHNALDKLIGWGMLNNRLPFSNHIVVVSGRASYELLQKTAVAGAPIFCAVSAPSTLAVSLAVRFNITLVGFLRTGRFNVYSGRERIKQ